MSQGNSDHRAELEFHLAMNHIARIRALHVESSKMDCIELKFSFPAKSRSFDGGSFTKKTKKTCY